MAAYAYTHALDSFNTSPVAIGGGLLVQVGTVDITNYNTTSPEITEITGAFGGVVRVLTETLSDNDFVVRWDNTDQSFHAFDSGTADAKLDESASDVDVGVVRYIAIGTRPTS